MKLVITFISIIFGLPEVNSIHVKGKCSNITTMKMLQNKILIPSHFANIGVQKNEIVLTGQNNLNANI